ncbi:hypothetical protein BPTFM16_00553 [Altererythrobacter insulae]|nr:hypothetical protein BPTFM16_00553 [Altererythrobacter insulae]
MSFLQRLNAEQLRLSGAAIRILGFYIAITTAAYFYLDVFHFENDTAYVWLGFGVWGLGFIAFVETMNRGCLFSHGKKAGVGSYFAISAVISIFVALGAIALILPGLYLLIRWLGAYARVLASDDGVGNSMRWSWDKTESVQRDISISLVIPVLIFCSGILLRLVYDQYYEVFDWNGFYAVSLIWNSLESLASAWMIVLAAAVFSCLEGLDQKTEQTFE